MARCFSVVLCVLLALSRPSYALSVSGVPEWLENAVSRSLYAVWSEIPDSPEIDRYATLEVVAARLFAGYDVKVKPLRGEPAIFFSEHEEHLRPDVRIVMPDLRGMSAVWFEHDTAGMSEEVCGLLEGFPQSALTWADEALRERIGQIVSERLPGWEFSQQIYISQEATLITLTFRPSARMVLAVRPAIYSRTIPAMFRTDMEAKLIPEFSPLIGLPVEWAELHRQDIEAHAREFLEDRNTVDNLRADVSIKFRADTVSEIEANADSKDFMFQMWVAAYAGIEGRYPETGVFFGFRPDVNAPEVYTELIFSLDDFGVVSRIGGRYNVGGNFFAGLEMQWPESEYFLRLQYIPLKVRRLYGLWRWSPGLKAHEAALGYRIDEHVSLEIYYYSMGDDKLGIRGTWHL